MNDTTSNRVALYPGSFDGLTYGHLDLIQRGRRLFDKLYVGVAQNPRKTHWLTIESRLEILKECCKEWDNVEPIAIDGLTIETALGLGARFIVRGLRAVSDFEFEIQFAIMNQQLDPRVETIFMAPDPEWIFLSSSMVREIWSLNGDVSKFVPPQVIRAFEEQHGHDR